MNSSIINKANKIIDIAHKSKIITLHPIYKITKEIEEIGLCSKTLKNDITLALIKEAKSALSISNEDEKEITEKLIKNK